MLSVDVVLAVCLGYVALLFAIAFIVDRRTRKRRLRWLNSPVVYTLSISIYCTSWTFYGAVGSAARNGLERGFDDALEPHRDAGRAAGAGRRAGREGGLPPSPAGVAARLHRRRPGTRLPLFPVERRLGRARRDRADRLRRRRPVPAEPRRRHLLAGRHADRRPVRPADRLRAVGLYALPAELRGRRDPERRGAAGRSREESASCVHRGSSA